MKFRAKIRIVGTDQWYWETFQANIGDESPSEYVRGKIAYFNGSLRPHEKAREYGGIIKILDKRREHEWEKTNLVTISDRQGIYDTAKCKNCLVTSRRYGIGGTHVRDKKYKAKKWERCQE